MATDVENSAVWYQAGEAVRRGDAIAFRRMIYISIGKAARQFSLYLISLRNGFSNTHTDVQQRRLYGGRKGRAWCEHLGAGCGGTVAGRVAKIRADARLEGTLEGSFWGRHGVNVNIILWE